MANCSGCPYRWHDSDCEYCSKRNNEVIDLKNYSKSTCAYYKEYEKSNTKSSSSSSSSSDDSFSPGCSVVLGLIIIGLIISAINLFTGGSIH